MVARYVILALAGYVSAQVGNANFNQVINLNGDMNLNSIQFPDGSRIEAFSQTQRQLLVNQNQAPLPGNQVTGSTGNPFIQLSQNSLIIQTNGGTDLVGAQIELPIQPQILQQNNVTPDNTFVAKLAPDRRSWMIMETIKSVNATDNTVRLVKMNNIDGEYIALGRQTPETSLSLTQFSSSLNNGFNVTGSGIQENEFTDGFRMSVRSTQPMLINTNVINGVSSTMMASLGANVQSVNNYRYLVNTNLGGVLPNINRMVAVVQLPINPIRLQTVAQNMGAGPNSQIRLSVAQRGILANPGGAQGIQSINKRQDPNQQQPNQQQPNQQQPNQQQPNQQQPNQQQPNTGNTNGDPGNTNGNTNGVNTGNTNGNTNGINNQGTGTNNNPAATRLLLSPTFTPIAANAVLDQMNGRLAIPISQVDGEYIITVQTQQGGEGQQIQGGQQGGRPEGQGIQEPQGQQQGGRLEGQGQQGIQGQQGQLPQAEGQRPQAEGQRPQAEGQRPQAEGQRPAGVQEPQGIAPQAGEAPRPAAAEAPRPAGITEPAGVAPPATGITGAAPAAAVPAAAPIAAPLAAPAAPAAAPAAAAPAAGVITRPIKRQFGNPAAPLNAPLTSQQTNGGGVWVSMAWVNMMARIQTEGLPVNVGFMMEEFLQQQGVSTSAAAASPFGGAFAGII